MFLRAKDMCDSLKKNDDLFEFFFWSVFSFFFFSRAVVVRKSLSLKNEITSHMRKKKIR